MTGTTLLLILAMLALLFVVRGEVAFNLSMSMLDYIHSRNMYLIDTGRQSMMTDYDEHMPSHINLMLDLTLWTSRQAINRLNLPEV